MPPGPYPCTGRADLFFPETRGVNPNDHRRLYQPAKTICAACPHTEPCRREALDRGEPAGVWGGTTPAERSQILGRRLRTGHNTVTGPQSDQFLKDHGDAA